jgi:uncharacterized membrane protein
MEILKSKLFIFSAIIIMAIFTRFIHIDSHSIYIDETWVVPTTNFHFGQESIYPKLFEYPEFKTLSPDLQKLVRGIYDLHPLFQVAAIRAASDVHPPLYFFVNYYWSSWFGYELDTIRTPAALYFIITLILLYYCLMKQSVEPSTRFTVLVFLIFTPLYLFFSNFARPYTLLLLLCLASFYLSHLVIQSGFKNYRSVYIILAITCMYTHYFGALAIASQGIFMLYESFRIRQVKSAIPKIIIIYLVITLLFLPWFFVLLLQMKTKFPRLEENAAFVYFDFNALLDLILFFSPGYSRGSVYSPINWVAGILQVLIFFYGAGFLFKRWKTGFSRFWLFSFFCPFLLIILFNTITPVFTVRNCAIVLIPYITICGFGLSNIKISYLKNGILAILLLIGAYFTLWGVSAGDAKAGRTVESWKSVASYLHSLPDGPRIYVHHSSYRDGLFYYIQDLEKVRGLSEDQAIEGPEDDRFVLVVVNHSIESIEEKIKRELNFLNHNPHMDYKFLKKIAETYIYLVTKNTE